MKRRKRRLFFIDALPKLLVGLLFLSLTACGSPLDEPVGNISACRDISDALRSKCAGQPDKPRWLNCDVLPGCPSGQVERADVAECVSKIGAAGSCAAARAVQCTIAKTDCASPQTTLDNTLGYDEACNLVFAVMPASCFTETAADQWTDAQRYVMCNEALGCDEMGAYLDTAISDAVTAAQTQTDCTAAKQAVRDTIGTNKKYCFETESLL